MSDRFRTAARTEGYLLITLAVTMILPLLIAVARKETASIGAFALSIAVSAIAGLIPLCFTGLSRRTLNRRDGFLIVSLSWLTASVIGALPFIISGAIPNFIDAFFESCSGFTTTGASILTDIEALPSSVLFWRSFTHFLGGMGIVVLITAILPSFGINGQLIANSETTGPTKSKIAAKFSDVSRHLYKIYLLMTAAEIVLLMLGGLNWYDAAVHTFGTVGTGGMSSYNDSIAHFASPYVTVVIAVFMLLAGINFNLYYAAKQRGFRAIFKDEETRFYLLAIGVATAIIFFYNSLADGFHALGDKLLNAFFQVVSITTTTGYMTDDFDAWPAFSRIIILALFFIGGCSSSTGGGIKCVRILVAFKLVRRGISLKIHPNRIAPVTLNERELGSDVTISISNFIFTYIGLIAFGMLLISTSGADLVTNFTAAASCIGNVGPGFELVGPTMNYAFFSGFAKIVCSMLMIIGRLEIYTVLVLFSRHYWNPHRV